MSVGPFAINRYAIECRYLTISRLPLLIVYHWTVYTYGDVRYGRECPEGAMVCSCRSSVRLDIAVGLITLRTQVESDGTR